MGWSSCDWSREAWDWRPEEERWSANRHGTPKSAVYLSLNTDGLPPREAYDFWRETALYDVDADHRRKAVPFQAEAAGVVGPEGAVYVNRADALSGRRRRGQSDRDGCEDIAIGIVTSGRRGHEEGDERSRSVAGQFLVYDARRASRLIWSPYASVHLTLKRTDVEVALGGPVPSSASLAMKLTAVPTGRILAAHLRALADELGHLDPAERAGVLAVTLDLARLALADIGRRPAGAQGAVSAGLFAAALRLVEVHLANPDLGPDMLAGLMSCSRATLYRCFAERGRGIADVIRERRLHRAHHLIETAPRHIGIAEIALRCGYADPAHFSRAFRQEYGTSPSEMRA